MKITNRNISNTQEVYTTSDFCLASTLLTLHFDLVDLNRSNPRRIVFSFSGKANMQDTLAKYWNNSIDVSPQDFFDSQKRLKTRMYQGEHNVT